MIENFSLVGVRTISRSFPVEIDSVEFILMEKKRPRQRNPYKMTVLINIRMSAH